MTTGEALFSEKNDDYSETIALTVSPNRNSNLNIRAYIYSAFKLFFVKFAPILQVLASRRFRSPAWRPLGARQFAKRLSQANMISLEV